MLERLATAVHLHDLNGLALLDILILATVIYQILLLIRGTRAVHMIVGVVALVILHFVTRPGLIYLPAVHAVLGDLLLYIPLAVIVLFQQQIRQVLARVGRNPIAAILSRKPHENVVEEVALAAVSLASKRLGALIVVERELGLRAFSETGITLDAYVSYDLIVSIFQRGAPLHDGAVVIVGSRIRAACAYLPLTTNPNLSRALGTRHRAAVGITEESDAVAIVVSEQRGVVSFCEAGRIEEDLDAHALSQRLEAALAPRRETWWPRARRAAAEVSRESRHA
ncbi:MAG TPA: diadenylate cyclase CdaA [Candidatus Polarisedimenticolaceae bacterium]|nr:diadenylate cyclase CdaA [Candidatus Polarisedimenticolaceae bacterium]